MNREQLLKLRDASSFTPEQLARDQPELFGALQKQLADRLKSSVQQHFQDSDPTIRRVISEFSVDDPAKVNVRAELNRLIEGSNLPSKLKQEAKRQIESFGLPHRLDRMLHRGTPLHTNLLFRKELSDGATFQLGLRAGLTDGESKALVGLGVHASTLNDDDLDFLVQKGSLGRDGAAVLGLRLSLSRALDENERLVDAVSNQKVLGRAISSVSDLAAIDQPLWEEVIQQQGVTLPEGLDVKKYAMLLERRMAALYPTDAMLSRLRTASRRPEIDDVEALKPLLQVDPDALFRRDDKIDLENLPHAGDPQRTRSAFRKVAGLARRNPGLEIERTMADQSIDPGERVAIANKRLDALDIFLKQNSDVELLRLDYTPDSDDIKALKFDGIEEATQPLILNNFKAYQRMDTVTSDALHAGELISAGYHSAATIASDHYEQFSKNTSFDSKTSKTYYERAHATLATTGMAVSWLLDTSIQSIDFHPSFNFRPSIESYFQTIDGFAELFGDAGYCDCEKCSSVIGPAAYFVDLMCFVESNVLDQVFVGAKADHVLNLKKRRPDLWSLELTCENTNTEIPLLVIACEIFENYIAKVRGFTGNLSNRTAVAEFVYKQTLADTVDSFDQPLVLAFEELKIYLSHSGRDRSHLLEHVAHPVQRRTASRLGVPAITYDLMVTPNAQLAALRNLYGIDFQMQGSKVAPQHVQRFLDAMRLDRKPLGQLVSSRFVTAQGTEKPQIKSEKRNQQSAQNDIERIHNLTLANLDRMHRLVRVSRASGLTFLELDVVDQAVRESNRAADVLQKLADVVELKALSKRFGAPVEIAACMLSMIPDIPAREAADSLFDSLFNTAYFVERDGTYPNAAIRYLPPVNSQQASAEDVRNTSRIRSALQVSSSDLGELTSALATVLGFDLSSADPMDHRFPLTRENLSQLYRHATVMDWLSLSVTELFWLIELNPAIVGNSLASLEDVLSLIHFVDELRALDIETNAAMLVTGKLDLTPENVLHPTQLAQRISARVIDEGGLRFAGTIFAQLGDVTEADSRRIIDDNAALFDSNGNDEYLLADDYDPTADLAIPAGVATDPATVRNLLAEHHAGTLATAAIAGELSATVTLAQFALAITEVDVTELSLVKAIKGTGAIAPLADALDRLVRLAQAMTLDSINAELAALVASRKDDFGLADPSSIPVEMLLRFRWLQKEISQDRVADLTQLLGGHIPASGFDAVLPSLAAILQTTESESGLLNTHVARPANPIDRLKAVVTAHELLKQVGVGADVLSRVASDDYDDLQSVAAAVLSGFRQNYPRDVQWKEAYRPYQERLLNRRRDGLVAYLVDSIHPEFETVDDLYRYFLIDPQINGCFPTSRVVSATLSVQAYVNRVLMNLEKSQDGAIHVKPELIPVDEWDWRRHYRVWEANRKVYLWTENYLDPNVRDDKTTLFEEFETTLQQQELSEQAILDAYATYLEGFEVLSNLRIAGSYHDIDDDSETDVLHLIGVTAGDPPQFYYRTAENVIFGELRADRGTVWNPWQTMDVKIPVRTCSPVVHNGRLHVFWVEIVTTPQNEVKEAGSRFVGYHHRLSLRFSTLRLDGRWTVPQSISLYGTPPFIESNGIIDDPLIDQAELKEFNDAVKDLFAFGIFGFFMGQDSADDLDAALKKMLTPRYDDEPHTKSRDGYTLATEEWTRIHPESTPLGIRISGGGYQFRAIVDLFDKTTRHAPGTQINSRIAFKKNATPASPALCPRGDALYYGTPTLAFFDDYAYANLIADEPRFERVSKDFSSTYVNLMTDGLYKGQLAQLNGGIVLPINGSLIDAVIDRDGDLLLLQGSAREGRKWLLRRIGTTLSRDIARALFVGGIDGLLETSHQLSLGEAPNPIQVTNRSVTDAVNANKLDFRGAMGTYYQEIFLHIPLMIAWRLQEQGKNREAMRWYQFVFDPTAVETIADDPNLSAAENEARKRDRNWRYRGFRDLGLPQLREILTDSHAIEMYKRHPFSPHAIGRLRPSAYQKWVVTAYVKNILELADREFSKFQQDTINEALILYQIAKDVLGPRPTQVGDCGEAVGRSKRSYASLRTAVKNGSDFLAELEHLTWKSKGVRPTRKPKYRYVIDSVTVADATWNATLMSPLKEAGIRVMGTSHLDGRRATVDLVDLPGGVTEAMANVSAAIKFPTAVNEPLIASALKAPSKTRADVIGTETNSKVASPAIASNFVAGTSVAVFQDEKPRATKYQAVSNVYRWKNLATDLQMTGISGRFGWSVARQIIPTFCIPGNHELLELWDWVDDRLYKIRNCLDINGNRRQLALFAPEIDPRMLINARNAGLSIDDVLNAISGSAPPYRFRYLLEKAKQYTATVQSFGAALQSALEKKDAEALNQMRLTHQQNLLAQTSRTRHWEYDIAVRSLESLQKRREMVQQRLDYYYGLTSDGLIDEEHAQRIAQHTQAAMRALEGTLGFLAGALNLIPQVGSPFAMKYGGVETGNSAHRIAVGMRAVADVAGAVATSAAMEATFVRRHQGWQHQVDQARSEIAQIEKDQAASELRVQIAARAIELHELSVAQAEELAQFSKDKFTNVAHYNWMVTTLQKVHRDAYNCALSLARLAEQAFRFERNDPTATPLSGDYISPTFGGILAGNRLSVELEQLDKRYIETTTRELEIDQTFSLFQIDPAALVKLKETGSASFSLPEYMFDLFYPGHYRRRLKAVRMTIPCVTGPHANVSATLTLLESQMRVDDRHDQPLQPVVPARTESVATSSAQNDAGLFELSFYGERYLPFEGAGAISTWQIDLPSPAGFPPFDYNSISDVLLRLSYTAESSGTLRDHIQQRDATVAGTLAKALRDHPLSRIISLKTEHAAVFQRLVSQTVGSAVDLEVGRRHFPVYMQGGLKIVEAKLAVAASDPPGALKIRIDGHETAAFGPDPSLGGLQTADIPGLVNADPRATRPISIVDGGDLSGPDAQALHPDKVSDLYLILYAIPRS